MVACKFLFLFVQVIEKGCPYFASRVMATGADLVFCPYNYLLEPSIRKNLGIKLENSILIFDESHNIESVAAEVASFECDLSVLESAVGELPKIVEASENATVTRKIVVCVLING